MALLSELTEHSYDTARLARMVEALWERVTGQSIPSDPGGVAEVDRDLTRLLGNARSSTRMGLELAQNLIDYIDGPQTVDAPMALSNRAGDVIR